jgi:pimeloyl-ACP methyl ester carboxylesterase
MTSRRSRVRLMRERNRVPASPAPSRSIGPYAYGAGAAGTAALLGISAFVNHRLAKKAERDNPPAGRFIEVAGVRLHVVEKGKGTPLVLLHGNGSMVEDFGSSGLIEMAASRYRVIAFDRPGHGHSSRPRSKVWTDAAQADLIHGALAEMGVSRAIVLGHSWGCSVAVALALNDLDSVAGLVLASGYYYPGARADVVTMSGPALPVIGDILRYAVSPVLARIMWPLLTRKIFGPAPVPAKFEGFPKEMTFRPSQIGASAAESAMMIPDAFARADRYGELTMPVIIIAGEEDRLVDTDNQSGRLHAALPQSTLHRVPGVGHMVHQTATECVMAAIDDVAAQSGQARRTNPTEFSACGVSVGA